MRFILLLAGWIFVSNARAQFTTSTNSGAITITGYSGTVPAVLTIPATLNSLPVVAIGSNAFAVKTTLKSVSFSTNLTSIGSNAFFECLGLTNITFTNGLTNIGPGAFSECLDLVNLTLPNTVLNVGSNAFSVCRGLTNLVFGTNIVSIGDGAFSYCIGLAGVTIPASVTNIGVSPFQACSAFTAISVAMGNSNYTSQAGVLFNANQTTLVEYPGGDNSAGYVVPDAVIVIAPYAFSYCAALSEVTLPTNLATIGAQAFANCDNLSGISISAGVTSIGDSAFYACTSLEAINVSTSNAFFSSAGGVLFDKSETTLLQYPQGSSATSYSVPNGVTTISDNAFAYSFNLTNVVLPNTVKTIEPSAFYACTQLDSVTFGYNVTSIGDSAFAECTDLASLYFQGAAPTADSTIFTGDNTPTVFYLPGTSGWGFAFAGDPTSQWALPYPLILNYGPSFGVRTNKFGFVISWANTGNVIVQASTNIGNPVWIPIATNALVNGSTYFSDANWASHPVRFYQVISTNN